MDGRINTIKRCDCIEGMQALAEESVDLAFADPPFNIGYDYDVYSDCLEYEQYIAWSADWMAAVHRVLKPDGTFWLAIGDDFAAELKIESRKIGFHCRSWVVWYYTFGVNCVRKFTRSHTHLFHFVKDPKRFTFRDQDLENRIPSARELVYNDKRANAKGRLPDDTWIIRPADAVGELVADDLESWLATYPQDTDRTYALRPQDMEKSFKPDEDTWYFPRVAGTFRERAGFHGCQMPEQLLGRIIRTCSNPEDLVLDPFSGSATTLAVAKKLGRRYLGYEISESYVRYGLDRLRRTRAGDRLDGSPEPTKSAPKSGEPKKGRRSGQVNPSDAPTATSTAQEQLATNTQVALTLQGLIEAFRRTHEGFSADRVVADPDLNRAFVSDCETRGLVGDARTWNTLLFRLRKQGRLSHIDTRHRTTVSWEQCDSYFFASEIAWQMLLDEKLASSLDEILCDPPMAARFDEIARRFAPGYRSFDYRWAALKIRKEAKFARTRAAVLTPPVRLGQKVSIESLATQSLRGKPGLYLISENGRTLYAGETIDLRRRFQRKNQRAWLRAFEGCVVQTLPLDPSSVGRLTWQSCLVKKLKPSLNCFELGVVS